VPSAGYLLNSTNLSDAPLEFHGRADRQVKLGGARTELGDVEYSAATHPRVRQVAAAALPRQRAQLVHRERMTPAADIVELVLFYTTVDGAPAPNLREHLAALLPPASVPTAVVLVDAMPQTANGKIDMRALVERRRAQRLSSAPKLPAGLDDPEERRIASAVAEVIGVDVVDMEASFVALGGSSLAAMQVTARLRRETAREVVLADVLEAATLHELASRLRAARSLEMHRPVPPLELDAGRLPLTSSQLGVYYQWRLEPNSAYYNYQAVLEATWTR